MKKVLLTCALALLTLMSSCRKDPEIAVPDPTGQPDPSKPGTDEITDEKREAILEAVRLKFVSVSWENRLVAYTQIIQLLLDMPEIEDAGYSIEGGNAWARFRDGELLVVVKNPEPAPADAPTDGGRRTAPGGRMGVPGSPKVVLLNGMGNLFRYGEPGLTSVSEMFAGKGYVVDKGDATVERLKGVKDAGVFYLNTHGGYAQLKGGQKEFVFWTSDSVTTANVKRHRDDLRKKNLAYVVADNSRDRFGKEVAEKHLAVTTRFVTEYMTFSENALLYLNACSSFSDAGVKAAFLKKTNNTGTYIGWTNPVSEVVGYPTLRYVFDRLLGHHNIYIPQETPKQRSFQWELVFADLARKGLGQYEHSQTGPAQLAFEGAGEHDALLRPGIEQMGVDELNNLLILAGSFGEDPGEGKRSVSVNGVPLPVLLWDERMIQCRIEATGAGSAGDVVVRVGPYQSHPRTLTEWRGEIKYTRPEAGSVKETITYSLHLRADINPVRELPGQTPKPFWQGRPLAMTQSAAADSRASYWKGGAASHTFTYGCTQRTAVSLTTVEGVIPITNLSATPDPSKDLFTVMVRLTEKGFQLSHLSVSVRRQSKATTTSSFQCPDGSGNNPDGTYDLSVGDLPDAFDNLTLAFDGAMNIEAGGKEKTFESETMLLYGGPAANDPVPMYKATLRWGPMQANFLPKQNAPL